MCWLLKHTSPLDFLAVVPILTMDTLLLIIQALWLKTHGATLSANGHKLDVILEPTLHDDVVKLVGEFEDVYKKQRDLALGAIHSGTRDAFVESVLK